MIRGIHNANLRFSGSKCLISKTNEITSETQKKKTCVHLNQWTFETVGLQIIDGKDNKISRETGSVENEAFIV